uniref:F-box domain-containing protein n=1 Tax=Caenorhabditis tropicalis TaxID=1561998 RepID=A0A1I7TRY0_9PELO
MALPTRATQLLLENPDSDQKSLPHLPNELLLMITNYLDFKSQMHVRNVAHHLRDIVDHLAKPPINEIKCEFFKDESSNVSAKIKYSAGGFITRTNFHKKYDLNSAIDHLGILLKNRRLQLSIFYWKNTVSTEIDRQLLNITNSLNHRLFINYLDASLAGDMMVDFVKVTRPGILNQIFQIETVEPINLDRLVQLRQFKSAKKVDFSGIIPDFSRHARHFLHFDEVFVKAEKISMEAVLALKEFFTRSDQCARFSIDERIEPSNLELEAALAPSNYQLSEEDAWHRGDDGYRAYAIPDSNDYLDVVFVDNWLTFERC